MFASHDDRFARAARASSHGFLEGGSHVGLAPRGDTIRNSPKNRYDRCSRLHLNPRFEKPRGQSAQFQKSQLFAGFCRLSASKGVPTGDCE